MTSNTRADLLGRLAPRRLGGGHFLAARMLSAEQLALWDLDGYLLLPGVFSSAETEEMRAEVTAMAALTMGATAHHGWSSGRAGLGLNERGETVLLKLQPYLEMSLLLQRMAADPRVVGPLAQIMGDEPVLMPEKSKINYKQVVDAPVASNAEVAKAVRESAGAGNGDVNEAPAGDFGRFPIHNDYAYYRSQRCPASALTSCIVLDDCTPANGPLRIWSGSHRTHLEHEPHRLGFQVKEGQGVDFGAGADVLAEAGSFLIFSVKTLHNSQPNTTPLPRRLVIFAHAPAQEFEAQVHPGNTNLTISAGAHEMAYLRARASAVARL
jgi:phytanoyl-CoA hydroxylase